MIKVAAIKIKLNGGTRYVCSLGKHGSVIVCIKPDANINATIAIKGFIYSCKSIDDRALVNS